MPDSKTVMFSADAQINITSTTLKCCLCSLARVESICTVPMRYFVSPILLPANLTGVVTPLPFLWEVGTNILQSKWGLLSLSSNSGSLCPPGVNHLQNHPPEMPGSLSFSDQQGCGRQNAPQWHMHYKQKAPALWQCTSCTISSAFYFYEQLSFGHLYQLPPCLHCSFQQSCGMGFLPKYTPQCLLPFVAAELSMFRQDCE